MKVLVIIEWIPESTNIYCLDIDETKDHELLEQLIDAHGKFINVDDDTDAVNFVLDYLEETSAPQIYGQNAPKDREKGPLIGPFDMVVHAGFVL